MRACVRACETRFLGSNPGEVDLFLVRFFFFLPGSAILSEDVVCVML